MLRLHGYRLLPLTLESSKTRSQLLFFRNMMKQSSPHAIATELHLWNQLHKKNMNNETANSSISEIKDFMCNIPRLHDILKKWNISQYQESSEDTSNEFVKLSIFASTNYIQPKTQETCNENKEDVKLSMDSLKNILEHLPSSVKIILDFWGGGMTVDGNMGQGRTLTRLSCENHQNMERYAHYEILPRNLFV